MSRYTCIHRCIWNDDKFPFVGDDLQLVFFHLCTTPISNQFGYFKTTIAALAGEKRWPEERYRKAFEEGIRKGFFKQDEKHQMIWVVHFLEYNKPNNPNVLISWGKEFRELPDSTLKDEVFQFFDFYVKGLGEAFQKAFAKAFAKPSRKVPVSVYESEYESVKEGGAGGDSDLPGDHRPVEAPAPPRPPDPEPSPAEIVAREKAQAAWRDLASAISKRVHDGLSFTMPTDKLTREVVKGITGDLGISGLLQLYENDQGELEKQFTDRYSRRDLAEFAKRARSPARAMSTG